MKMPKGIVHSLSIINSMNYDHEEHQRLGWWTPLQSHPM